MERKKLNHKKAGIYGSNMYNINISSIINVKFEWDEEKARINLEKHNVSFVEAASVFHDPYARIIDDLDHSDEEMRKIILGLSCTGQLFVTVFSPKGQGEILRIISARKATRRESEQYWGFRHEG